MKKNLLSLILSVFAIGSFAQTNSYTAGWDAFLKNDREGARKSFAAAVQNPSTAADAYLSLSLMDWIDGNYKNGFENFKHFYASAPQPYAALYAVSSLPILNKHSSYQSPEQIAFYEKVLADNKLNGTLRATTNAVLAAHYRFINNDKKAIEHLGKLGSIDAWQVLGSFDNTSGSGFVKDWGAVSKTKQSDDFKNKVNADVRWYVPEAARFDKWFDFDDYFVLSNTINYAQTFVHSPETQTVYLRVGTSGSLKVWLNDALVASVIEERNCDLDLYGYKVQLNKGNNRVLVQIGQSEIDRANFLLRFTDENASPIAGLTASTEYANYHKDTKSAEPQLLPFYPEDELLKTIAQQPENPLYKILLAQTYLRNDKAFEATSVLKKLEEQYPKSTIVSNSLMEAYLRAKNQTDLSREMESIKTNDAESYIALQTTYNEAIEQEKYSDAEDIWKKMVANYGENEFTDEAEISIASYQKRVQDVFSLSEKLYKKYPYEWEWTQIHYQLEKNKNKNNKTTNAILEKFNKKYYVPNALSTLAWAYMEQGNYSKGLALFENMLKKSPGNTNVMSTLSNIAYQMQNYKSALEYNNKMLKIAPYISNFYSSRGYICKSAGDTKNAKQNFEKAIYYGPTSYDSRTQIRQLDNKKDLYELFPKTDLSDLIKKAPKAADYPQDNAVVLLNEKQMIVYPENAKEYRKELAVKILTKAGVEDWKEYGIEYYGSQKLLLDKAEVLKANGTTVKAETNNNGYVVFTDLEVNDVLHLDYRVQDYSSGKLAQYFSDDFDYEFTDPSLINRFSLLVPQDKKFDFQVVNGDITPAITNIEDRKLYIWEANNIAAVKTEPYMSSFSDVTQQLYLSSFPDWKFISDWYKDLTFSKFTPDYVFTDTYNTLMKGNENLPKMEKAEIFYDYILENFTYSSVPFLQSNLIPQKPSRTITTRLGDCKDLSTLFVALCRQADIEANLVLILTRDYGSNNMPLPSIGFNHCIAQMKVDNTLYYLELTNPNLPFGAALNADLKSQILPIPFGNENIGSELLKLEIPIRSKNASVRTQTIKLSGNNMEIARKANYIAGAASDRRGRFKNIGSDLQSQNVSERVSSSFNKPLKINNLQFVNLDNLKDTVSQTYDFTVTNALQDVASMLIFKLPWTDYNSLDLVSLETRKYPLEYWAYQSEEITTEIITLELPAGKAIVETPKNVKLECSAARYEIKFDTSVKGKVKATRIFTLKEGVILPAQYADFRKFLNEIAEMDERQYAVK
ncbi:MAG: DUF3857 domain-containing protein [Prevotellaceae bacterium]|jgi:predicted Zn-dependent protease/transglutaminase-like putative cysteine protease|nr:DUF3857 domain-containing protein [Prevotellaceae bacterium]